MSELLTVEKIKSLLPKNDRRVITSQMVDTINAFSEDDNDAFGSAYRENFVSYLSILKDGDYKIEDYRLAVKYISYKLMDFPNIDAYQLTFPDRYDALMKKHKDYGTEEEIRADKISSYVSMYNKNKLVNKILDQTLVPNYIINAPLYQQALNVQAHLMMNSKSDMVKTTAANSLLTHLKPPEALKMELSIGMKESDAIADLRQVTQELAKQQLLGIQSGASTAKDAAQSHIFIEAELDGE